MVCKVNPSGPSQIFIILDESGREYPGKLPNVANQKGLSFDISIPNWYCSFWLLPPPTEKNACRKCRILQGILAGLDLGIMGYAPTLCFHYT